MAIVFSAPGWAHAQEIHRVEPEHEVYDHLEHFRALGAWDGALAMRPMSRRDLRDAIASIALDPAAGAGDRGRLARLAAHADAWTPDTDGAAAPSDVPRGAGGAPRVLWEAGAAIEFFGGPATVDSVMLVDRRPRRRGLFELSLDAQVRRSFGAQLGLYADYGRFKRRPDSRAWVDNLPTAVDRVTIDPSIRLDRAVLFYATSWAEVRFGREDRRWGTGRRGGLFLSENPYPLDGLSVHLRTRRVSLTSLFAQTQRGPDPPSVIPGEKFPPDSTEVHVPGDAYVAMHRLEVRLPGRVTLGLYEAAAYGGRGIDLAYVNPVGVLLAMTQDIYDQSGTDDKKVAGLDASVGLRPFTIYGEFLLDRLVVLDAAEDGDEAGISSFAELVGVRWANPFGISGADLDVELAHLDPQVYFHHDRDIRRALVRDDLLGGEGRLLGHWLGPNADDVYVAFRMPIPRTRGMIALELEQARWGLVDGRRGDEIGFFGLEKKDKDWITGDVARERVARVTWSRTDVAMPLAGRADVELSAARIDRSGPWRDAAGTDLGADGWQIDARLRWHFAHRFRE